MIQTPTKPSAKSTDAYWEKFEHFHKPLASREPAWLAGLRKAAIARFAETGFPTLQDEDWRFTNVAPIAKLPFDPSTGQGREQVTAGQLHELPLWGVPGTKLVFVNGQYAPELSKLDDGARGLTVTNLASLTSQPSPIVEEHLGRHAQDAHNPFAALNMAFFTDGAFIHVPAGLEMKEPVHLVHVALANHSGAAFHPRHLIVADTGSKVCVLEHYVSLGQGNYITNAATELVVREGARLEHCKLQSEDMAGYHVATIHLDLHRGSNAVAHSFALGAKLSRNNIRTHLGAEGIECILNGLYLTRDEQLADHHMIVDHAKPHCNSHEYFNGVLDHKSRGVFHGRILVRPDAQKTDAKQTNKNLLLSDDAGVDTKPQLEIYADDVKCTHGATIGQLNEESIFYLRARGIGLDTARRMLMHAFAGEIIERIRHEGIREELDKLIWERLEQNRQIAGKG